MSNVEPSSTPSYAHGLITLALITADRMIVAHDSLSPEESTTVAPDTPRAIEVERGVVIAASGIWAAPDSSIDTRGAVTGSYRRGESAESFIQHYDTVHRHRLEMFLTSRFATAPEKVLHECFCPLTPPLSLMVCEASVQARRAVILEYIPRLTNHNRITLTPLVQRQDPSDSVVCAAIGAGAPYIHLPDPHYVRQALLGSRGPEYAARILVEEAIGRMPAARLPVVLRTFSIGLAESRSRRVRPATPMSASTTPAPPAQPPVDTANPGAVEQFVSETFVRLFPNVQPTLMPHVFHDVVASFGGDNPDYGAIDVRYHDLEHTLQSTVCLTLLLAGYIAARASPRLDARHFELAIAASLLHDTGYLKLRSDIEGTGAKYTFCHVLRGCAFAASYLPTIGGSAGDLETILSAINCTGPANEISRLRFQAPVDEIIGCAVATADFLGQMAATEYPNELTVLFDEFQESDEFLHVDSAQRAFGSAADLLAHTPDFWHRYVLPRLEADFHGVYRFLARPYPDGPNRYIEAVEANICEIQRRISHPAESSTPVTTATAQNIVT